MKEEVFSEAGEFSTVELKLKGFSIHEIENTANPLPYYSRRDFYKICIVTGKNLIQYADREIEIDGTFLFFGNPHIPYSSQVLSEKQTGYGCLFTEDFIKGHERSESLQQSPLFKIGGTPVLSVTNGQAAFITMIFQKMQSEQTTEYMFKAELIRNYIFLIIHEALKLQPIDNFVKHKNAHSRVATFFLELLERQFPVENADHPIKLKTAQDFAENLSIHVNYLNRSVKEITGKTTTAHIAERIIAEAKALLQHTNWSINDIAYSLGFEYPSYFNNYFKRMTATNPLSIRAKKV
jgi:AraC family transcriptional regulator, transcriptional activator of pobA